MVETDRRECPGEERVAAYAEHRLRTSDAAAVEAHLADCDDCRQLFTTVAELLAEPLPLDPPRPGVVDLILAALRRPRGRALVVSGLAAAALLAVLVRPDLNPFRQPTPYEALVAAVGTTRTIEGRLSGGFQHGELRSPTRSAPSRVTASFRLLAAVARLKELADEQPTPVNRHALGVAQLVVGDLDSAVGNLEAAVEEAPTDARFQSDLAVAHLARAKNQDAPAEYVKALDAAERALKSAPQSPEALFNRALALEGVALPHRARSAWQQFLTVEPSGAWSTEARDRLTALSAQPETERSDAEVIDDTGPRADVEHRAVEGHPDRARDYVDDTLAPRWGAAWLARDFPTAGMLAERCTRLARALEARTGDRMPVRLCQEMTAAASDPDRADSLATGLVRFGEARQVYERDKVREAAGIFSDARRALEAAGSVQALWCHFHEAITAYYDNRFAAVDDALAPLLVVSATRQYSRLQARAHWMLGLTALQRSDYGASLSHYGRALAIFEQGGDAANSLAMHTLLADALSNLSDGEAAWRHRLHALRTDGGTLAPRRRHTLVISAANASLRERSPAASVHFAEAALAGALASGSLAFELEARLYVARALDSLGDAAAAGHMARCRDMLDGIEPGPLRDRFEAEVAVASASIEGDAGAERHLNRALAIFEKRNASLRTSRLRLDRGELRWRQGDLAGAEADLLVAKKLFLDARTTLPADELVRLSHYETGWPVFARLVDLRVQQNRLEEAYDEATEGRLVAVWTREADLGRTRTRARLEADEALLSYVVLEDRLLVWVDRRNAPVLEQVAVTRTTLRRMVARWRDDLAADAPSSQRGAEELYRLLIQPVVKHLEGVHRLIVVPDDAVAAVPFLALVDPANGRHLLDAFEVTFGAPRASRNMPAPVLEAPALVVEVGTELTDRSLARLPEAAREAAIVAELIPQARRLRNADATKQSVLRLARGSGIVHFAGHALANSERPLLSRLIVSGEEPLFAYELLRQNFTRTELVVLSACSSIGGPMPGAGLVGLSSALVAAGVGHVVGTMWDVEDDAASAFTRAFYTKLIGHQSAATALRGTLQELRTDRRWQAPRHWAVWSITTATAIGDER